MNSIQDQAVATQEQLEKQFGKARCWVCEAQRFEWLRMETKYNWHTVLDELVSTIKFIEVFCTNCKTRYTMEIKAK